MYMKTKDSVKKSWGKTRRLVTVDSRSPAFAEDKFRGNDDYQASHRLHVIPAKAGIHFSYIRSLRRDSDATLGIAER